jgi:hypothetical protein
MAILISSYVVRQRRQDRHVDGNAHLWSLAAHQGHEPCHHLLARLREHNGPLLQRNCKKANNPTNLARSSIIWDYQCCGTVIKFYGSGSDY